MMPAYQAPKRVPKFMAVASIDQAAPVQNTYYTVLSAVNVEVHGMKIAVAVTDETINFRITADGVVSVPAIAATAGTTYHIILNANGFTLDTTDYSTYKQTAFTARNLTIEARKTTNAGAGNLSASVRYSLW